jgi:polyphosphate kinase 2 (PPK2 family)
MPEFKAKDFSPPRTPASNFARPASLDPKVRARAPGGALPLTPTSPPRAALAQDALEPKPAPLGGAARAPSGAVVLPALGRPRVDTFESVWRSLSALTSGAPPTTLEAAVGVLGELGFELRHTDDTRAELTRGKFTLAIAQEQLGREPALRMSLEAPAGNGLVAVAREAVVMGRVLLPSDLYAHMKDRHDEVMADFRAALADNGKKPLPTTFDQLKAFIDGARPAEVRAKDALEDAQIQGRLDAVTDKLEKLRAAGQAPRSIIVYADGPDGTGKTSTGAIVLSAITKAGYDTDAVSFKAPTAAEREQHWLQRFQDRGVPTGEQTARFWDRGPAGDAVYGDKTAAEAKKMAGELRALERGLAEQGVLLFKVHVYADQEKQADTFGKRLGRQGAADELEQALAKRGPINDATHAALDNIRSKINGGDIRAMAGYHEVQSNFVRFSKAANYHVVDASHRHEARLSIIDALSRELDAFAAARA